MGYIFLLSVSVFIHVAKALDHKNVNMNLYLYLLYTCEVNMFSGTRIFLHFGLSCQPLRRTLSFWKISMYTLYERLTLAD